MLYFPNGEYWRAVRDMEVGGLEVPRPFEIICCFSGATPAIVASRFLMNFNVNDLSGCLVETFRYFQCT